MVNAFIDVALAQTVNVHMPEEGPGWSRPALVQRMQRTRCFMLKGDARSLKPDFQVQFPLSLAGILKGWPRRVCGKEWVLLSAGAGCGFQAPHAVSSTHTRAGEATCCGPAFLP